MRPNFLLISLDTLRFDCVKAAEERRFLGEFFSQVSSPNIDRLAANGVLFTQAVSASPFTTPSHASIFTGLCVADHAAFHHYKTAIAKPAHTIAERLASSGYLTAMSAGHDEGRGVMFASKEIGLGRGFQTQFFSGSVDDSTRGWLRAARGKPWFLFFHTFAAHWPYGLTGPEADSMIEQAGESGDWARARRVYVENAPTAGAMAGELVSLLEELGEIERTAIIVLSDHGEGLNPLSPLHGPINGGREEVIRVPLVISAPWLARRGARVEKQVRTVDLLPTILDLAGVKSGREALPLAGESLRPFLEGKDDPSVRLAFFTGHLNSDSLNEPLLAGVRTGRWKLIIDACSDEKLHQYEGRLAKKAGVGPKARLRWRILREMHRRHEPVKLIWRRESLKDFIWRGRRRSWRMRKRPRLKNNSAAWAI